MIRAPRGTFDVLPDDAALRRTLEEHARQILGEEVQHASIRQDPSLEETIRERFIAHPGKLRELADLPG